MLIYANLFKKYSGIFIGGVGVGGLAKKQFVVQGKKKKLIFIFLLFYCAKQNSNFSESVYSKYLVQFYNLSIFPDLKNWPLKSVLGPIEYFCPYYGSQWNLKPFGYQHSSKYLLLCFTENRKPYRFEKHEVICIFGWTMPLRKHSYKFVVVFFKHLIWHASES